MNPITLERDDFENHFYTIIICFNCCMELHVAENYYNTLGIVKKMFVSFWIVIASRFFHIL